MRVAVWWACPVCSGPRGEPREATSFDGTYRLVVDRWDNPCSHVDKYDDVRREAARNGMSGSSAPPGTPGPDGGQGSALGA